LDWAAGNTGKRALAGTPNAISHLRKVDSFSLFSTAVVEENEVPEVECSSQPERTSGALKAGRAASAAQSSTPRKSV